MTLVLLLLATLAIAGAAWLLSRPDPPATEPLITLTTTTTVTQIVEP